MKYPLSKYKFFEYKDANGKSTISAMSTYAGKNVKGYAKCDPRDQMNSEMGRKLAAARCNAKIADKRVNRAQRKFEEAQRELQQAKRFYERMHQYYADSLGQAMQAKQDVEDLKSQM